MLNRLAFDTQVSIFEDDGHSRDWPETWRGNLRDAFNRQGITPEHGVIVSKALILEGFYEGDGFSIYLVSAL